MPLLPFRPAAWRGYLELLRPANVATALADVLAGYAVTDLGAPRALALLLVSTACLYAGGIAFNDFFDRSVDAIERPERPIPSGRVPPGAAALVASTLLVLGVLFAWLASSTAGAVSVAIVASVVIYDAWGKRRSLIGPINMGLCRGLNLTLGMAAVPGVVSGHWALGLLPLVYIAGVTLVSRGEVHGGTRRASAVALALVGLVVAASATLAFLGPGSRTGALIAAAVLAWQVLPAFSRAVRRPVPDVIGAAVRMGVLSLVLLDAVIAAAYAGIIYTLAVVLTALLAGRLSRLVAVT
ncbi:MAG: UbiA-like protein EboC [Vicinamibacterales bacterium]